MGQMASKEAAPAALAASTSAKARAFQDERVRARPVSDIPGMGDRAAEVLKANNGIEFAYEIIGVFLTFKKDKAQMIEWLRGELKNFPVSNHVRAADALEVWCENNL